MYARRILRPARLAAFEPSVESLEARTLLAAAPFSLGGNPLVHPEDFTLTTFFSGLSFPSGMAPLSDGSLLVATTNPLTVSYFGHSRGQLYRLVDTNKDGLADGRAQLLADNLPPALTDLSVSGSLVFVTGSGDSGDGISPTITILGAGATPASALVVRGTLTFTFPTAGYEHKTYAVATRPTPGSPGSYDVFFGIGSEDDSDTTSPSLTTNIASDDGRFAGDAHPDSIYKLTVTPTKHGLRYSNLTQIAFGVRNAAGIAIQPGTGNLYFEDNGINGGAAGADNPQLSADELNVIPAAQIGVGSPPDFGYAHDYIVQATGQRVGSGAVQPLTAFLPVNGSIGEGPQHIAFTPAAFPPGLNAGVMLGFYGQSNYTGDGLVNTQNPVSFADTASGEDFQIIGNDFAALGHPVGLVGTSDSVFIADLAPTNEFGPAHTGVIYQIKANPRPFTLSGTAFLDTNANGKFDAGDAPAKYRTVYIDENNDGTLDAGDRTAVTNRHGGYSFTLPYGRYVVSEALPARETTTTPASYVVRLGSGSGHIPTAPARDFGSRPAAAAGQAARPNVFYSPIPPNPTDRAPSPLRPAHLRTTNGPLDTADP